jgi:serine/threonine protein kinase
VADPEHHVDTTESKSAAGAPATHTVPVDSLQGLAPGKIVGEWKLTQRVGGGGNGEVWAAHSNDGTPPIAIKFLRKIKPVAIQRFKDEVAVIRKLAGVPGILPIIRAELDGVVAIPWFAMPLATELESALAGSSLGEVVTHFSALADTLAILHQQNIYHRDIKPKNLLFYEGRAVLSDFGIAKFPGYGEVTLQGNVVGPGPTMAPEVRRKTPPPNSAPADVFGLAKSLWMILARHPQGFDGEYSATQQRVLALAWPEEHLVPLHRILTKAIAHEPEDRSTAKELAAQLSEWVAITSEIDKRAPDEWLAVEADLFPYGTPEQADWRDPEAIRSIVDRIGSSRVASHVMLPGGGGQDIIGASNGRWPGTLELDFGLGSPVVVSPSRLHFRRIENERASDFFLLEVNPIEPPAGYRARADMLLIEFVQLPDGRLIDASVTDRGEWAGKILPAGSRAITWCLGGSFLLVMRTSRYNRSPDTYDGRHGEFTADHLAKILRRGNQAEQSITRINAVYEEEDLSWQFDRALRPVLKCLRVSDVVILIRKWPRYRHSNDLGILWEPGAALSHAAEGRDTRRRLIANLLDPLHHEALRELVSMMYIGRDHRRYPVSLARWQQQLLSLDIGRDECSRVLLEKVEAPKYLAWGLRAIGAYKLKY